jgi:hypothetical protein
MEKQGVEKNHRGWEEKNSQEGKGSNLENGPNQERHPWIWDGTSLWIDYTLNWRNSWCVSVIVSLTCLSTQPLLICIFLLSFLSLHFYSLPYHFLYQTIV